MKAPSIPSNEAERLAALRAYEVLDTDSERAFDDIVDLASHLFEVPTALVSLIDDDRQWFKAKIGLDACETGRDISFCGHAILQEPVLVVEDATTDTRFFDNPLVVENPHIRFYAGAPLVDPRGFLLGTLCIIDYKPRGLSDRDTELLKKLAKQVVDQFELRIKAKEARKYLEQVLRQADALEEEVNQRTAAIEQTREQVIRCLARAAEYRDDETGCHVQRVGAYVQRIAEQMGLDESYCKMLGLASTLHDIGKIGVPDSVLLKPDRLTENEFGVIQGHAGFGSDILDKIATNERALLAKHCEIGSGILRGADYPLLAMAEQIARTHHEKYDGTGYPVGLSRDDIPLPGRITAVADVFDALSSERPYKKAIPVEDCLRIMEDASGTHFDPEVLDAFKSCFSDIRRIQGSCQPPIGDAQRVEPEQAA